MTGVGALKQRRSSVWDGRPKVLDVYSGAGGLSLGLEQAGFSVAAGVEAEETTGRYAQYNFPDSTIFAGAHRGDARRFRVGDLKDAGIDPSDLFMVVGGPPCQGFSIAGKRRNNDPLNELVLEFSRIVLDICPPVFIMENVPGLTTSASPMLGSALRELEREYEIAGPQSLKAWEFGVPQMRQRVFIVGIKKCLKISPSLPLADFYRPTHHANLLLRRCPTCWEAISDLPEVDEYEELISGDRIPYTTGPENNYQSYARGVSADPSDFRRPVEWDESMCTNLRRTRHGKSLISRFKKLSFGRADPISGIRRLDPGDISTTIRAGTTKSRGSWSAPRPLHPFQNRVLTTRECARIQSFPDWFLFHPVKWHGNRMVGNAVPPLVARAVGSHIRELLGLPRPVRCESPLRPNQNLVGHDILAARQSGYEHRKVSQLVVSWSTGQPNSRDCADGA